jgi:hypothetical protein
MKLRHRLTGAEMWKERSVFMFAKPFKMKALLSFEMLEKEILVTWRNVPSEWNP